MGGMSLNDSPTLRQLHVPVALVIGGTRDLVRIVEEAAVSAQVLVAECTVAEATTAAAEMRPLVMIMSEDVFGFDPESFEALAQDVRSQVVTLRPDNIQPEELKAKLKALMLETEDLRSGWTGEPGER